MSKKVKFPRKERVLDCTELGYPGVSLTLWDNPSRRVRLALYGLMGRSVEELEAQDDEENKEVLKNFFWGVSQLVFDSNIEGADFSTLESVEETFDILEPDFLPAVIAQHLVDIIRREDEARKKLERPSQASASTPEETAEPQKPSESES